LDEDLVAVLAALTDCASPFAALGHRLHGGLEDLALLVQQQVGALADRFLRAVAVEAFRAAVPVTDAMFHVPHQDRILRAVEQGGLLRQALLVFLVAGDVVHAADHAQRLAAVIAQDQPARDDVRHRTILAYETVLALPLALAAVDRCLDAAEDRKSTRLNSSHVKISYAV